MHLYKTSILLLIVFYFTADPVSARNITYSSDSLTKYLLLYLKDKNAHANDDFPTDKSKTTYWSRDSLLTSYLDTALFNHKNITYPVLAGKLITLGNLYVNKGLYEQAINIYKAGLLITENIANKQNDYTVVTLYGNIGSAYWYLGDYEEAGRYYYASIHKNEQSLNNKIALLRAYNNLALMLYKLKEYSKAKYYLDRAKLITITEDKPQLLAGILITYGNIAFDADKNIKAIDYYQQAQHIGEEINNKEVQIVSLRNIGQVYIDIQQPEKAITYLQQALNISATGINPYYTDIGAIYTLGKAYLALHKYGEAEKYLLSALSSAEQAGAKDDLSKIHRELGNLYEATQHYPQALQHQKQYHDLTEEMYTAEKAKAVNLLEIKYRTTQKDKEIATSQLLIAGQKASIWKKNTLIFAISSSGIILILLIVSFYIYRQRLQSKKIRILQQDQELRIMQALIDGEEKERSRMAQELHDGIGGLLSTTKMYFETIQTKYADLAHATDYEDAIQLLDETLVEVRKTAHNLLPELVLRHGLPEAVKLYCSKVSKGKKIEMDFQYYGHFSIEAKSIELSIYRIIQELIQNILKHAHATKALVQISAQDDVLSITVEDNGIGMKDGIIPDHGTGLATIQKRLKNLGGQFNITSVAEKGTYIYLEFDLNKYIVSNEYKGIHS